MGPDGSSQRRRDVQPRQMIHRREQKFPLERFLVPPSRGSRSPGRFLHWTVLLCDTTGFTAEGISTNVRTLWFFWKQLAVYGNQRDGLPAPQLCKLLLTRSNYVILHVCFISFPNKTKLTIHRHLNSVTIIQSQPLSPVPSSSSVYNSQQTQ